MPHRPQRQNGSESEDRRKYRIAHWKPKIGEGERGGTESRPDQNRPGKAGCDRLDDLPDDERGGRDIVLADDQGALVPKGQECEQEAEARAGNETQPG